MKIKGSSMLFECPKLDSEIWRGTLIPSIGLSKIGDTISHCSNLSVQKVSTTMDSFNLIYFYMNKCYHYATMLQSNNKGFKMVTVRVATKHYDSLRTKAFHQHKTIQAVLDEILSTNLNTPTTQGN